MSIVGFFENTKDRTGSGTIREAPEYRRSFTVRVDNPNESLLAISSAPGIRYGDLHPDDNSVYVKTIDVVAEGDSLLLYRVTFTYGLVTDESVSGGAEGAGGGGGGGGGGGAAQPPDPLVLPIDTWSGSAGLYSTQRMLDVLGNPIENTAQVPFAEGVTIDAVEGRLTLVRSYAVNEFDTMISHLNCINKVNNAEWPGVGKGSEVGWWRVSDASWNFRQQSSNGSTLSYYEATFGFAYRRGLSKFSPAGIWWTSWNEQTETAFNNTVPPWCPMLVSKGYTRRVGGKQVPITRPIEYKNCAGNPIAPPAGDPNAPCDWPTEEPVTEPFPLDVGGDPCGAGEKPCLIVVNTIGPDNMADFGNIFGSPRPSFLPPLTSP